MRKIKKSMKKAMSKLHNIDVKDLKITVMRRHYNKTSGSIMYLVGLSGQPNRFLSYKHYQGNKKWSI